MEDAAVVSGLMTTGGVFFFQNRDGAAGELAQQLVGSGEADDASADDKHVLVLGLGHGRQQPQWDNDSSSWIPVVEAEMTLSFDHRILDGGAAGRLLWRVSELLQSPENL